MAIIWTQPPLKNGLDSVPDVLLISDTDGCVEFANGQLANVFGYSAEEILGCNVEYLIPHRFHASHADRRRQFAADSHRRQLGENTPDLVARRKDGLEFPVQVSLEPFSEGGRTLIVAAIRDTSEFKRIRTELAVAQAAADGARRVAEEAQQALVRARAAENALRTAINYSLRQAIHSLSLLSGVIRRGDPATMMDAALRQAEAINDLTHALDAMTEIGRADAGGLHTQSGTVSLAGMFEYLREVFQNQLAAKGLQLLIESQPVWVRADSKILRPLLALLLAWIYRLAQTGIIRLDCRVQKSTARIEFHTTEAAFTFEQLATVQRGLDLAREPAQMLRSRSDFDLAVMGRLAQLLGTRVEVGLDGDMSTILSVEFPLAGQPEASEVTEATVAHSRNAAPHVLIIADDHGLREAAKMLLTVEGYRVSTVNSLAAAEALALRAPDIQLLLIEEPLTDVATDATGITELRRILGPDTGVVRIIEDGVFRPATDPRVRVARRPVQAEMLLSMLEQVRV